MNIFFCLNDWKNYFSFLYFNKLSVLTLFSPASTDLSSIQREIFFLPFLLFGGWEGFTGFLRNLTTFVEGNVEAPRDHLMNYANILSNLTQLFFGHPELGRKIANITLIPFTLVLVCLGLFACKKRWKCVLILTLALTLFPNANGYYAMTFYIFPLVFLLLEKEHRTFDYFYAFFISLCILPLQFLMGLFGVNFGTLMQLYAFTQSVLLIGLVLDALLIFIQFQQKKKISTTVLVQQ